MNKCLKVVILSVILMLCLNKYTFINSYAQDEIQVITEVEKFSEDETLIYLNEKESENALQEYFPTTVKALTSEGIIYIPVTWKCFTDDYEETNNYYYQFVPQWDEQKYKLAENVNEKTDLPYIFVCFGEPLTDTVNDNGLDRASSYKENANMKKVIKYLTGTIGLSSPAACGAAANIYCESGCIADIIEDGYTWENGGGYGICQWTNYPRTATEGRRNDLIKYCAIMGYDYKLMNSQLKFLNYELSTSYSYVLNALKDINVSGDAQKDSYDAAYLWCYQFESPKDKENASIARGNFAKSVWLYYGDENVNTTAPKLQQFSYPQSITQGRGFAVAGKIIANNVLTNVKVAVIDSDGKEECSKSVKPNSDTYDISILDSAITFDKLSAGMYYYKITAKTEKGNFTLLKKNFVVCNSTPMITGYNIPQTYDCGNDVMLAGTISCSNIINSITAGIYKDRNGKKIKYIVSKEPYATTYDMNYFNDELYFEKLSGGYYYYRIDAVTSTGTYNLINEKIAVNPLNIQKVETVNQIGTSPSSISIKWDKSENVSGYKVYRSDAYNGKYVKVATTRGMQYIDNNVKKYRIYYYKIYPYVKVNGITTNGAASEIKEASTNAYTEVYRTASKKTYMYDKADSTSDKIKTIKADEKLNILYVTYDSKGKKWYKVKYGTKIGYLRSIYTKSIN